MIELKPGYEWRFGREVLNQRSFKSNSGPERLGLFNSSGPGSPYIPEVILLEGGLSFEVNNILGNGFFNEEIKEVNGMKPFLKSNRFGYKSKDEILFIPAIYEDGFDFYYNDLAYVKINNRWGYIDKLGNQYWED